jgi:hypothetical protein
LASKGVVVALGCRRRRGEKIGKWWAPPPSAWPGKVPQRRGAPLGGVGGEEVGREGHDGLQLPAALVRDGEQRGGGGRGGRGEGKYEEFITSKRRTKMRLKVT